tara:strand:- start:5871 stop:6065 length:195 start_codon:yes stop_codon:yes gene_type:complete
MEEEESYEWIYQAVSYIKKGRSLSKVKSMMNLSKDDVELVEGYLDEENIKYKKTDKSRAYMRKH